MSPTFRNDPQALPFSSAFAFVGRRLPIWLAQALTLTLFLFVSASSVADQRGTPAEQWSVIKIAGTPVGYVFEATAVSADRVFILTSDSKIILNRLGNRVELETRSRSEESSSGRLLRVDSELRASVMSTKSTAIIRDGKLEITSEAGGKSYSRTVPYDGEILGPEGIRRLSLAKLRGPGDVVEFQTFSSEMGGVTKGRRKAIARETVSIGNRAVVTLKVEETLDTAGVSGLTWLDENGESVKGEMPTPFGVSEIIRTDRETALSAAGGEALPAEMFERSILKTNIRLPRARALEMLRVKLSLRDPGARWPDLARPGQAVISETGRDLVLEIRRPAVPVSARRPVAETEKNREFLQPNESIQSDLPEIRRTAFEVVAGESDVLRAALKLERWVSENMTFDLGIAFAPSSELIKNRRGTCLGYATLLATLTRAVGIPSRVVLGYVYAQGMFGGHAWTEVLAGLEWIPIDAAIVSSGIADPARIAFSASSLAAGTMSLSGGAAARLFGGTDIKILAYGLDGRISQVPEGSPVFRIEEELYTNPGLGFSWVKPSGFAFAKTEAVWPDPTVVALEGPNRARVTLQEMTLSPWKEFPVAAKELLLRLGFKGPTAKTSIGTLAGLRAEGPDKSALVVDQSPDVWILLAEGKDASAMLDQAIRGLRINTAEILRK